MSRFIASGPDIPERLLWAHEEGRVVFFCGAGISYPAGLPDFKGLVDQLYAKLGTQQDPIEEQAFLKSQYDATLDLLERRYPGQRLAVRTALAEVLKPKWRKKGATTTHEALLQLATDRQGKVRLVTTNFDRIFQCLMTKRKPAIPGYAAPLLPIPKPTRWHGVVHLHGLLPDLPDEISLNRLVLTSGDFGLAYLTERWAARFVSELFRYYTVCFVGYSLNDPVLRYMMDALAVDEMLGETRPKAYACGSVENGGQSQTMLEWEAKGVTPLLYDVPSGTQDHSGLHLTLKEWADTYRDGVRGKEMIVALHASTPPLTSSRLDFAVGRVLWALTDGLAVKHFADLNPVPPLGWLEPLAQNQFKHEDLPRFGVTPKRENDEQLAFSIIQRPSPYTLAPQMSLVDFGVNGAGWDEVMFYLARWLTRHLDDPKLVLWVAKQGGQLHARFAALVQQRLMELDRLTHDNNQEELDRIRAVAPKSIPTPLMRVIWRLILSGRLESHAHRYDLYDWLRRFKQDGLTPTLRLELRETLTPRVALREPFRWQEEPDTSHETKSVNDLVEWEIVLSVGHVYPVLRDVQKLPNWSLALPELLQDFSLLLRDVLDLKRELGGAQDKSDLSYLHHPSISAHAQNNDVRDWTALIDLVRDAWVAAARNDPAQAQRTAEQWQQTPYPLFKRLAFFAAALGDVISPRQSLDWLLADGHWWLWSVETERESLRLLVALAPRLDNGDIMSLEQAILHGPSREMVRSDIEPEHWERRVKSEVWLRLKKAHAAGAALGQASMDKLDKLTQEYPEWKLATDESDEFPFWMGEAEGMGRKFIALPIPRREVVAWIKQHPSSDHWNEDGWRQRCHDDFPTTAYTLFALSFEGEWPADRWRDALQAWAEDKLLKKSWRFVVKVLAKAPDSVILKLEHPLSYFLEVQAQTFVSRKELFFNLIHRLLKLKSEGEVVVDDDPVSRAINHPVGHVTEALLRWWYRQDPKEGQGLPNRTKLLFTELCDTQVQMYRHGRVLLAAHAIALFQIDEGWVRTNLLPLFDWHKSELEARAAWEGFLWSPRLYQPFLSAIKQPMLEAAIHYKLLGKHAHQFAAFLTYAALNLGETFTRKELAYATGALPVEGLQGTAQTLVLALEGAGEQREAYWHNRVLPYFKFIWPKSVDVITPAISESFARLCIEAREAFPEAFGQLKHWLKPVNHPDYLIDRLSESTIPRQFPTETLMFLNSIIGDDAQWLPQELGQCLEEIKRANLKLVSDERYTRLNNLLRRRGIS
jgi:hypothetical protein